MSQLACIALVSSASNSAVAFTAVSEAQLLHVWCLYLEFQNASRPNIMPVEDVMKHLPGHITRLVLNHFDRCWLVGETYPLLTPVISRRVIGFIDWVMFGGRLRYTDKLCRDMTSSMLCQNAAPRWKWLCFRSA